MSIFNILQWRKKRIHLLVSKDKFAIVLVGVFSLLVSILMGVFYEIPIPAIHDEFSYLLAGDTFAAGRITNPTHPMWEHFETFHVFHLPTYQSKYPPGQGLFLALGKILADLPILGVWISLALAYSATCWALLAVFPRSWAFYGSMVAVANPNILTWWGQSYWGGAVAMLGGTLLFGAVFRLQQRLSLHNSLLLGLGIVILTNSRPFEGGIACCAATPIIVVEMRQWILHGQGKQLVWKFLFPLAVLCFFLAIWTLFYNHRLTGNAFKLPHSHWEQEATSREVMQIYRSSEDLSVFYKAQRLWYFFIHPVLSLFVFGYLKFSIDRKAVYSSCVIILMATISIIWSRAWPHYISPISCLFFLIIVQGFRSIKSINIKNKPLGRYIVLLTSFVYFANSASILYMKIYNGPPKKWSRDRSEIVKGLENQGPKDLIIVHYSPCHNVHREWVYNDADIDHAEVVWARELSPRKNQELFEYFSDRNRWLLLADLNPPRLLPYPNAGANTDEEHRHESVDTQSCKDGT